MGRGLPARPDRGNDAHRVRAVRRCGRGGAQAAVRGRDPGPGTDLPVLVAVPVSRGPPDPQTVPLPRPAAALAPRSRYRARVSQALDSLIDLLDLEQIEVNIFRGRSPSDWRQRVFGGQVAGQALVAAGRTVPADRPVHSLHAYFIRPGDPAVPIVYTVEQVRDGRSFTTRRVTAIQHGKAIFTLSASFHHPEHGLEHAVPMPLVPPPEELRSDADRLADALGAPLPAQFRDTPIELRSVGPLPLELARDPSLRLQDDLGNL